VTPPRDVLRGLREGKRPRLRQAIYIAIYAVIVAITVLGMNAVSSSGAPEWTKYLVLVGGAVVTWFIATWEIGPSRGSKDVFGRDMLTATRHEFRARQETFRPLTWSRARLDDYAPAIRDAFAKLQAQPEVVASSEGWTWLAAESDWYGWPDPPRFVVLGFDASNQLRAAMDFDTWPRAWSKPGDWPFEPKEAKPEESA
jgi:hypothetical protein